MRLGMMRKIKILKYRFGRLWERIPLEVRNFYDGRDLGFHCGREGLGLYILFSRYHTVG
jgi:hypothetical protein